MNLYFFLALISSLFLNTSLQVSYAGQSSSSKEQQENLKKLRLDVCLELKKTNSPDILSIVLKGLSMLARPGKYGDPIVTKIVSKNTERVGDPIDFISDQEAENLILIGGTSDLVKVDPALAKEVQLQLNHQKDLQKLYSKINNLSIAAKKSISDCEKLAEKMNFNIEDLKQNFIKRQTFYRANLVADANMSIDAIRQSQKRLRMPWKIIQGFNVNDILESVTSGKYKNVLIITHSDENGQIYDSYGNEVPSNLFSKTHPILHTLAIFSCHGKKVKEFYSALGLLNSPSAYQFRYFFIPPSHNILDNKDVTPSFFAGHFLEEIDSFIESLESRYDFTQIKHFANKEKTCVLRSDINSEKNQFGVFINNVFIGLHRNTIRFNCSLLEKDDFLEYKKPTVLIRNLRSHIPGSVLNINNKEAIIHDTQKTPSEIFRLNGKTRSNDEGFINAIKFK